MSDSIMLANRRAFLFGAAGLLVAEPKLLISKMPILYGDGIHDDTAALGALFDGRPVKIEKTGDTFRPLLDNGTVALFGGSYLFSGQLPLLGKHPTLIDSAAFVEKPKTWDEIVDEGNQMTQIRPLGPMDKPTLIANCLFVRGYLSEERRIQDIQNWRATHKFRIVEKDPQTPEYMRDLARIQAAYHRMKLKNVTRWAERRFL